MTAAARSTPEERRRVLALLATKALPMTKPERERIRDARFAIHAAERHLYNDLVARGRNSSRNLATLAAVRQRYADFRQAVRDAGVARAKRAIAQVRREMLKEQVQARMQDLAEFRQAEQFGHEVLNTLHALRLDGELRNAARLLEPVRERLAVHVADQLGIPPALTCTGWRPSPLWVCPCTP